MRIGIAIEETWNFLHEIHEELTQHHQVGLFKRRTVQAPILYERINRRFFQRDLKKFLADHDVVFFEWASALLAAASHMPKTCGIVTRLHRYEMYEWVQHVNWDAVDQIILVSEAKRREFLSRFPALEAKTVVIYEAVDPQKFEPFQKPFGGDIGTLCHFTPRKRVYELILAFYELLQQGHDFHLHLGGGAASHYMDYDVAIHELVDRLGIQEKITFYGKVTEPWQWYRNVDIFISNAYSEGLQVAPIEAMACGCYCLAHCWGGADELLPETNLYTTDSQLNRHILNYAGLSEAEQQAENAKMRALVEEKFDVHRTKVQIRQILESFG